MSITVPSPTVPMTSPSAFPTSTPDTVTRYTRAWVTRAVVGLNLCPFAKAPLVKGQVRIVASDARDLPALLLHLADELRFLAQADPAETETTLLVHPHVLGDFTEFNQALDAVDSLVDALGLEGEIQVASFHPQYQFAGTEASDVANATNRSPYPTLHLLREDSIDRAVEAFPEPEAIVDANLRTLDALGAHGWAALEAQCRIDATATPEAP
jgi:uncharacterized protein